MDARVAVQLYGHKHLQTVRQTKQGISVGSGATHPVRTDKDWIPRYNWITLDIGQKAGKDILTIRIYPRVLNKSETAFIVDPTLPNEQNYLEYDIFLDEPEDISLNDAFARAETQYQADVEKTMSQPLLVDSWERAFIYNFANLPFYTKKRVVEALSLDRPEDAGKASAELLDCYIERVKEKGQVEKRILGIKKCVGGLEKEKNSDNAIVWISTLVKLYYGIPADEETRNSFADFFLLRIPPFLFAMHRNLHYWPVLHWRL